MSDWYRRDGSGPLTAQQFIAEGIKWGGDAPVAKTEVNGAEVSTVFLGLDHRHSPGAPLIFETLVFGGKYDQDGDRYSSEKEARKGHAHWVEKCAETIPDEVAALASLIEASDAATSVNAIRLAEDLIDHGVRIGGDA